MKKYLFILSLAGGMLTACSSGDDIAAAPEMTQEEKDAAIIAEATAASDVQIRLGFGSQSNNTSVMRSPVESDANGLFETPSGKYLGIYCLAQQPQIATASPGPVEISGIDWSANDANSLFYLMEKNQPAQVKILNAGQKIGNVVLAEKASDVQFLLTSSLSDPTPTVKYYYYPYGNWYNYHFYGYYPRQESGITETPNKVTVNYTLDGTQDLIYAKATPPTADVDKGFNAKYIREKQDPQTGTNNLEDLPHLALNHKLAQLRFYVQCKTVNYIAYNYGEAIGTSAPYKKLFTLKSLELTKVPVKWQLTVADRETTANEGTLTHMGTITGGKVDETDGSLADIPVKGMTITAGVADGTDVDALGTPVNIPYTGSELSYWKVVESTTNPGTYIWEAVDKDAYDAAAEREAMTKNTALNPAFLVVANLDKVYRVWDDVNGNDTPDEVAHEPLLVGYAMIPTTAMYGSMTIDNRGTNSNKPYITFTLNAGQTNGAAGTDWTAESQPISIPTDGFEAGKVYNVILNIPVPEEVHMKATLSSWEVVEVTANSDQNIDMTID